MRWLPVAIVVFLVAVSAICRAIRKADEDGQWLT